MVQRRQSERRLFEVLLPDGHKLWPDWLRKIDTLLKDEAVIEGVAQALETRWPQSRRRGRYLLDRRRWHVRLGHIRRRWSELHNQRAICSRSIDSDGHGKRDDNRECGSWHYSDQLQLLGELKPLVQAGHPNLVVRPVR